MAHIFLYGPVGAGKSTVGRILARDLNLPFVDSDQVIEANAGQSIFEIMTQRGEAVGRDLESAALQEIVNSQESVIALGGGALLREQNRTLVENNGTVIFLAADLETLFGRLHSDTNKRPLLAGDLRERLTSLLANRKDHYDSFPLRFDADQPPQPLAWHIQVTLGRFHLSAMGQYDAIVKEGGIEHLGGMLRSRGMRHPILVTDENVAGLQAGHVLTSLNNAGFDAKLITIPAGESYKNLTTISSLWEAFLKQGLDRGSTIVAVGGGVIGDMAGFAAATYMRGIRWVGVPTSLLSMVDASLGGKTGFDLPAGKNLIGSFHPPSLVLADPQVLKTLPEAEFISGLAEVVKHGVIADPELFDMCARGLVCVRENIEQIVKRAMAVKIKVIEEDPYERGIRAALNLGHTVGHAVELVSQFELRHGEAIAIGMVAEASYAEKTGLAPKGMTALLEDTLSKLGLPIRIPDRLSRQEIIATMRVDKKKNASAIRFALPAGIGKVELVNVTDVESVLE